MKFIQLQKRMNFSGLNIDLDIGQSFGLRIHAIQDINLSGC